MTGSKKNLGLTVEKKRAAVERNHPEISVSRQCELLSLNRSGFYYKSRPKKGDRLNETLMRLIDEQYMETPFYGVRRMTAFLRRKGYMVNRKRVERLMRLIGLCAIYPKKRTTFSNKQRRKYPYLLSGLEITRPNQVWSTDITYIRLKRGFVYLVAIMDWYSRYVLSWRLSTALSADFCIEALEEALAMARPNIFNSDQGVQFTSDEWIKLLAENGIEISMDGKGRVFDNIFVERLWRSLKCEEVYPNEYETVKDARNAISAYFRFYNEERPHQSLGYKTPLEVWKMRELGALPPDPQSLPLSGCLAGEIRIGIGQNKTGEAIASPASISPVPALGSVSTVALSSGRASATIPQETKSTTPMKAETPSDLHKDIITKQLTFTP